MINPEVELSTETQRNLESCFSVPHISAQVNRSLSCRVRYTSESGVEEELELTGFPAACLQHEIDHLDGKLFIDHLPFYERKQLMKKIKRKNADKTKQRREKNRKVAAELKRVASRKKRKKQKKTYGKNKRKK